MNVWLDDERKPPDRFDVWVKTRDECISLLKTNKVRLISLDHDLGKPENGTGYEVACWIEENAYLKKLEPLLWEIHSMNPVGRHLILTAMVRADIYWRSAFTILHQKRLKGSM